MARTNAVDAVDPARQEFRETMRLLLAADKRTFDVYEWEVFFEALRDVPPLLLKQTVLAMARSPRKYPFRPGDIRAAAEQRRKELIAADPWRPCSDCRELNGFVEITDTDGVTRLQKCGCHRDYQARMGGAGVPLRPLQLEAAADEERAS